jgi:hypothetical protein
VVLRGSAQHFAGTAMPLVVLLVILDVTLVVHAVRTGRASPWAFIILMVPGIGAIAYVVAVIVPDWFGSPQGQQTQRRIANTLNPEKRYRELSDAVEIADTIANRAALAEECLTLEKFEEAKRHFDVILARPMGDEPLYMVGKARAQFGLGQAVDTVAILDDLRQRWPDYQSGEAHRSMPVRSKRPLATTRRRRSTVRSPSTSSVPRGACATGCCWQKWAVRAKPRRGLRKS